MFWTLWYIQQSFPHPHLTIPQDIFWLFQISDTLRYLWYVAMRAFWIASKYFQSWRLRQVVKSSSQTNCRKRLCLSSFQKDKSRKHKTKSSQNNSLVPLYQSTYKVSSKESIWFNLFCWVCHILLFCSSLGCYSYLVENLRQLYRRQMKYCPLSFALIIFSPSLDVECQIFISLLWSPSYICLHIFWWKSVT